MCALLLKVRIGCALLPMAGTHSGLVLAVRTNSALRVTEGTNYSVVLYYT